VRVTPELEMDDQDLGGRVGDRDHPPLDLQRCIERGQRPHANHEQEGRDDRQRGGQRPDAP
jgi:hypothetical protein